MPRDAPDATGRSFSKRSTRFIFSDRTKLCLNYWCAKIGMFPEI